MRDALLIVAVLTGYSLFLLASPQGRCWRCWGKRRCKRWIWFGRLVRCRRCKGTGKRRRLAAVAVHRFLWSVIGDRLAGRHRERQQDGGDHADVR